MSGLTVYYSSSSFFALPHPLTYISNGSLGGYVWYTQIWLRNKEKKRERESKSERHGLVDCMLSMYDYKQ